MLQAESGCLHNSNCDVDVGRTEGKYKAGEQLATRKMEQEPCHPSMLAREMNPNTAVCFWIWIKFFILETSYSV